MPFNSYVFMLLFLPLTVFMYHLLNKFRFFKAAEVYLIFMSLLFCGYYNTLYVLFFIMSLLFNYSVGGLLHKHYSVHIRKLLIITAVSGNILLLLYFKYADFFIENINIIFKRDFNLINIFLPLGISFLTFQQIAYVIDCYRQEVPIYSVIEYVLYSVFFPKMAQGPIANHSEIVPQLRDPRNKQLNYENMSKGIFIMALGLGKKVILADTFGLMADKGYAGVASLSSLNALFVMLSYTLQIYFDFSGYCDMALGAGLMFNIKLPVNFHSPYKALTINDFWKRWHMTLTGFFTKYVYIPLGGSRKGKIRTYVNTMLIFLLSGFWHGASWTFVVWGILHGTASVITKAFNGRIKRWHPALQWVLTFGFVNIAWVYFRASSIAEANQFLYNIAKVDFAPIDTSMAEIFYLPELDFLLNCLRIKDNIQTNSPYLIMTLFFCTAIVIILNRNNSNERLLDFKPNRKNIMITVTLLVWSVISMAGVSSFLYFGF